MRNVGPLCHRSSHYGCYDVVCRFRGCHFHQEHVHYGLGGLAFAPSGLNCCLGMFSQRLTDTHGDADMNTQDMY